MARGQEEVVVPNASPGPFSFSGDRVYFSSELSPGPQPLDRRRASGRQPSRVYAMCVRTRKRHGSAPAGDLVDEAVLDRGYGACNSGRT